MDPKNWLLVASVALMFAPAAHAVPFEADRLVEQSYDEPAGMTRWDPNTAYDARAPHTEVPSLPPAPSGPPMPAVPSAPATPPVPTVGTPSLPGTPGVPSAPPMPPGGIPSVPPAPSPPGTPSTPPLPGPSGAGSGLPGGVMQYCHPYGGPHDSGRAPPPPPPEYKFLKMVFAPVCPFL